MRTPFFIILFSLFIMGCEAKKEHKTSTKPEKITLNGPWKFNTFYGEGANYLTVEETPEAIIIDNNDIDFITLKGNWKKKKVAPRGSAFYKEDFLSYTLKKIDSASPFVRFTPKMKTSGYFEAFVRYPFSGHLTTQINIKHQEGITPVYLNQKTNCNQWVSVGIYNFDKNDTNYIGITATTPGTIAADAVMFKPIKKELYTQTKKQLQQVHLPQYNDSQWHQLQVPGHWGMIDTYSNYTGKGWYRKKFKLPKTWKKNKHEKIRIQFDGVYHVAKVYLNGAFIGIHRGGFTPFEYDISQTINFSKENILAIEANNNYLVGATWNWGGIIRGVHISKNADLRIYNQYIHAEPDLKTGTAAIKLQVAIENNADQKKTVTIHSELKNNTTIGYLNQTIEIPAHTIKSTYLNTHLETKDVHLWHFDHPELYQIQTTINEKGAVKDEKTENFGIRKIEITDRQLLLNGEAVRIGGFNRVSEHRYWGSSEPLELLEKDIDLMKEAGANFMRIMHGTQHKNLIDLCDKKGILIFEEANIRELTNPEFLENYYTLNRKDLSKYSTEEVELLHFGNEIVGKEISTEASKIKKYALAKYWIKGMIERDRNHPSIIGWSVGNELADHYDYAKETMDYVRNELDPHRLVTCVSNSGQKPEYTQKTDPNTEVDIIMHNMYGWQGKPQAVLDTLRSKWPSKPIFISEFGFKPFTSTYLNEDKPIVTEWHKNLREKNNFVIGASMWTFNDYRSGYAGTTPEENRVWGLVNVWRQKRRLFDRVKIENSPVKAIHIAPLNFEKSSTTIEMLVRETDDYPSYTLKNYTLKWSFRNTKGSVISSHSLLLPTIHPQDKSWKGILEWNPMDIKSNDIFDFTLSLISPTGYTRFEKTTPYQVPKKPQISNLLVGNGKVRVLFEKQFDANEYYVSYQNNSGIIKNTPKTIENFIEIDNLNLQKNYTFRLIAVNKKGESPISIAVTAKPNFKILPPIIWKAFMEHQKLIIGYSSEPTDDTYTVAYGFNEKYLNQTFETKSRGMLSIHLNKSKTPLYFKIKRTNHMYESSWSPLMMVSSSH